LALNLQAILEAPIIHLDTIDSTNNYAMQLIDADKAQPGLTIVANEQTSGKGQRGKQWVGVPGESLLMSLIVQPEHKLDSQFAFNAAVATAIAEVLGELVTDTNVRIKWPNDMIVNDKKTGGILIENVLRGSQWMYSVIGIGINVLQTHFPEELPYATSLRMETGKIFNINKLCIALRKNIVNNIYSLRSNEESIEQYNNYLYKRDMDQRFSDTSGEWMAHIHKVIDTGQLLVTREDGKVEQYSHGQVVWVWGN